MFTQRHVLRASTIRALLHRAMKGDGRLLGGVKPSVSIYQCHLDGLVAALYHPDCKEFALMPEMVPLVGLAEVMVKILGPAVEAAMVAGDGLSFMLKRGGGGEHARGAVTRSPKP
jgi:hypothetical protein